MSVPKSTRTPLSVDLTSVSDNVLVRMKTEVRLKDECVHCLGPVGVYREIDASGVCFETASSLGGGDLEANDLFLIGTRDTIDLEPLLRDAIVTLVNERPLCGEDCQGLCDVCGEKRADLSADHLHESIDPRLAALVSPLESDQKEAD